MARTRDPASCVGSIYSRTKTKATEKKLDKNTKKELGTATTS